MNAPSLSRPAGPLRGLAVAIVIGGCAYPATASAQTTAATSTLGSLLGTAATPSGLLAKPTLGALSGRSAAQGLLGARLRVPGSLTSLLIPESFSVILWVRIEAGNPPGQLFGFGDPKSEYLMVATDATGAPVLGFFNREKIHQMSRAATGGANLADSRLHSVVAVVNLGSGLVRLYVDGRAEAATTLGLWRPRDLGSAFAACSLQGQMNVPGISQKGLLMPRIIGRELTEREIASLKPVEDQFDQESAQIEPELAARISRETLVEFWPKEFSYLLRKRKL